MFVCVFVSFDGANIERAFRSQTIVSKVHIIICNLLIIRHLAPIFRGVQSTRYFCNSLTISTLPLFEIFFRFFDIKVKKLDELPIKLDEYEFIFTCVQSTRYIC